MTIDETNEPITRFQVTQIQALIDKKVATMIHPILDDFVQNIVNETMKKREHPE